jgi:glycine cleavage system transcriptional repressor
MSHLILNAIGPDQPGLVGKLTGCLHAAGANILESRMVNLRGQFAIIILLEGSDDALAALHSQTQTLAPQLGLKLTLAAAGPAPARTPGVPYRLKTYSLDQPGLVHRITDVLRSRGVNIEDLEARQESAPFDGTLLFTMELTLTVPAAVPLKQLRAELGGVCEELNCDTDLEPAS